MATVGLYGSSSSGVVASASGSESTGLYGNNVSFGGSYFEWFIFTQADTQPATPTGGSWDFTTNAGTSPTGWSAVPPSAPTNKVWVSIALVNSKNTGDLVWSAPGLFSYASGLPILSGNGTPSSGLGVTDQLYIQLDAAPQTIWFKESGTWTRLTGSSLYVDLTSNQTIAGTKTFSSTIQGSVSGTSSNVTGTVGITNGGTGSTTASGARTALGAAASGANSDITSLSGLTTPLSVFQGGTGASTASGARSNLGAAASGANSDITSLSGITGGISTADFLQLDTAITPAPAVAKLQWDTTWNGPQIGMGGGNVNLQIGQETLIYVYNNTGSALTDGQIVYVTGSQGQRVTVALAQANSDSTSATIIGMVTEPIANGASGFVTTQGMVSQINTTGAADGAVVYLSPTTAGAWTTTKPQAPDHMVMVGYVVKGGSGGAGSIYIHPQNGYELDELHDVKITSRAAYNLLQVDPTNTYWQNVAGPTGAVVGTTDTQTLTNKTISGASNTLTNIGNSSLTNSSVTYNGVSVALGSSGTITANTQNALTFNNGGTGAVSGTTFNGSAAQTISYNTLGASPLAGSTSLTTLGTVTTGTWNASPIANSYLANSSITINGNSVSLGGSTTITAVNPNALTIGTGLSGTSYNGSAAVTIAIDSTVATLTGVQTLTNKTISGSSNTLSNIGNSSLTNSSLTIGSTSISLGGTSTTLAGLTSFSTQVLTASSDSSFTSTGALTISKGTTAQQPASPVTGMIRYNTTTNQFEGYAGSTPSWLPVGGSVLSNDTTTATNVYPLFANATSGTATTVYTSNANYLYKPSTGELTALAHVSSNGLTVNSATVSVNYTLNSGNNALSAGPITVNSGITVTVSSGSVWTVV